MTLDLVLREAEGMSEEALLEVLHFMRFIKTEPLNRINPKQAPTMADGKTIYRKAGLRRGQIWMAEDFDAPLDDFKEYM